MAWPPRPRPVEAAPSAATLRRLGNALVIGALFVYVLGGAALALGARVGATRSHRNTKNDARVVAYAATFWMVEHDGCPTLEELPLPRHARRHDAWGTPFRIDCSVGSPVVRAAGPDTEHGTEDDIHF